MIIISFTIIAILTCLSLYGWGLLCQRLARHPCRNHIMTLLFGLGTVIVIGGLLNLLHLAYGGGLDVLVVIGIALAAWFNKFKLKLPRKISEWLCASIPGLLIVVIMLFTVKTQLSPKSFNWHDDFEKYFAHPVRMLETGTLFGSPLNALGSETLGGQAFLHGIVLNHFPVSYINSVDAVFGLLLCMLLSVSMFGLRPVYLPMFLISPLVVLFINPQYVNVSALYMGSAFMMTSILLLSGIGALESSENAKNLPSPVLTGIVFTAIISLKSNFIVFPPLLLVLFIIFSAISGSNKRQLIRWGIAASGMTLLFVLPWLLLYLPYYAHSSFAWPPHTNEVVIPVKGPYNILSPHSLAYGSSALYYTSLCILMAAIIIGVVLWKIIKHTDLPAGPAAGAAAIILSYLSLVLTNGYVSGFEYSIRYSIPFLIAGPPIILSLVYLWALRNRQIGFSFIFNIIMPLLGILVIAGFYPTFKGRIHQAYRYGSILAFSSTASNDFFMKYSDEVINGNTKASVAAAQEHIPTGEAILAWISVPFYLDYRRNPVYDAERSGIATPWASIPDVNYIIYQYKGPPGRSLDDYLHPASGKRELYISEKCVVFLHLFNQLLKTADVIYDDGKIQVIRKLSPPPGQNP